MDKDESTGDVAKKLEVIRAAAQHDSRWAILKPCSPRSKKADGEPLEPIPRTVRSRSARAPNRRLDPLRHLLHDPGFLAADSSARGILALAPRVTLQNPPAHLDRNVGSPGHDY